MNLFRFVYIENYQRGSGAVRHGAEHDSVRHHLAPVLLAECQEKNVYTRHNYLM